MTEQTQSSTQSEQAQFKRHTACKLRIGDILAGKAILEGEKFKFIETNNKKVARVNLIANIIDKFVQDEEKKFASMTLDDASGQIRIKTFGEDISKFENFSQGDTVQIIGLIRSWNNELYVIPETIKKRDPPYLLLRKLECDLEKPKTLAPQEINGLKDKILIIVKKEEENGGADTEKIISDLGSPPATVNSEIKKLLEEGIIYEPRPGRVRYLG